MRRRRWHYWVGGLLLVAGAVAGLGAYLSDKMYLRADHAEIDVADFEQKFGPDRLKADFAALTQTIEKVHPDFADIVDQREYRQRSAEILAALDRPMNRREFWRVASAINGTFQDGHTSLRRPEEEWEHFSRSGAVVPLQVDLDDEGIVIRQNLDGAIPAGARLLSLNGVPAAALRDWMTDRTSGESLAYRRAYAATSFARWAWLHGMTAPYRIEWSGGDASVRNSLSDGVALARWDEATGGQRGDPLQLSIDGTVARLTVASLEEPLALFSSFLEDAFTRIRDRGVATLIIDIRRNGGGASSQGDLLQSYISEQALPAIAEVRVKTTPEVKARYRTLLPPGFRWIPIHSLVPMLRGIQTAPDNGFYTFNPEGTAPSERGSTNELRFRGRLYVLIGPNTYSSAAIFAAPLRHWGRAILVGQPTGEPLTFYGDNYEFDLPSTRLQASVSHKQFRLVGSTDRSAGVQPHVPVLEGGDAMAAALRHAESSAGRHPSIS